MRPNRYKILAWLTFFALALLGLAMIMLSGCTDTLEGNLNENLSPIVYFVNIPPEDFSFSHNPEVYWYGSDPDGQIDYYRYLVATADEIGENTYDSAYSWAAGQHDTMWTYVDVELDQSDPRTACVVPLTADLVDPVNTFVDQFVFVQAYDNNGAPSNIAARRFNRNDHPPATRVWNVANDTPFVNASVAGGIVTGVKLRWEGSDERDYDEQGLIAPPFEFEWRLFGPYTRDSMQYIMDNFVEIVFVTPDIQFYHMGEELEMCDSTLVDDNGVPVWEVSCTTIVFDSAAAESSTPYYRVDTLITVDDASWFDAKEIRHSWDGVETWVHDMYDTLYDVYQDYEYGDSTIVRMYLFWCRSRDDAFVPDPTPAFQAFPVINPKYERDVLVFDMTSGTGIPTGAIQLGTAGLAIRKNYWKNLIETWNSSIDFSIETEFDDYMTRSTYTIMPGQGRNRLTKLLTYKLLILYSDHIQGPGFSTGANINPAYEPVLTAIDAGVNCWITARSFCFGDYQTYEYYPAVPLELNYYFGVEGVFFAGWGYWMKYKILGPHAGIIERIEDFKGAYSIDESQWPNLAIDEGLLEELYVLDTDYYSYDCEWIDSIASLPEVNWCERRFGTEVMYLYKSLYGANHPMGHPYAIEGAPVAHRLETNLFKTAWFMFTPLCIQPDSMQKLANDVLDFLYDPTISADKPVVTEDRYPDAAVKITVDEARENYIRRTEDR